MGDSAISGEAGRWAGNANEPGSGGVNGLGEPNMQLQLASG